MSNQKRLERPFLVKAPLSVLWQFYNIYPCAASERLPSLVKKKLAMLRVVGNGATWGNQNIPKKNFIVKNLQTDKFFFSIFFMFQGQIHKTKLTQDHRNPQINSKDIFYVLSNNFSYTQLSFLFLRQEDSYYVHDDTDVFFYFSSSERFWYLSRAFFLPLFLFRKILMSFACFFSKLFFVFLK